MKVLKSSIDKSTNFIVPKNDGFFESRFVRRTDDYFICYLSSHNGCNKSCRFCHLTATKQTYFDEASIDDFVKQANAVFDYYDKYETKAERVNFNWMARGEPLSNSNVQKFDDLYFELKKLADKRGLESHFNISTIFPNDIDFSQIVSNLSDKNVTIYYSLYSLNPVFRKRWLPKASNPEDVFPLLKSMKDNYNINLALHWAFIKDENDSIEDLKNIISKVKKYNLEPKFNLVRYNPYSDKQGVETDENKVNELFSFFAKELGHKSSRIVPRVGFDVKASCGMFIENGDYK